MKCRGARNGIVMKALASYQCGHSSGFGVCSLLFAAIVLLKFAVMTTNRACFKAFIAAFIFKVKASQGLRKSLSLEYN